MPHKYLYCYRNKQKYKQTDNMLASLYEKKENRITLQKLVDACRPTAARKFSPAMRIYYKKKASRSPVTIAAQFG